MALKHSEASGTASTKIVIAGGFGSGKTTFVGAVSEIMPLRTEAMVTDASAGVDMLEATPDKRSTTVAMDFGRITLGEDLVLYLFGTPGQRRFWFMWDDLVRGAIGAIVLVDCRRLQDSFAAVDFFEHRNLPFLIAINEFDSAPRYPVSAVRDALTLPAHIPVINVDARNRRSATDALIAVSEYALATLSPAGGINAALLASSRVTGSDLGGIRDLWLDLGALTELLRDPRDKKTPSLLYGDERIFAALAKRLPKLATGPFPPTTFPEAARTPSTTLYITTTLLAGETSRFTDSFGTLVQDVDRRGLFTFTETDLARPDTAPAIVGL